MKKSWLLKFVTIDVLSEKKVCKANEFINLSWGFLAPEAISQGWQNIRRYWNFSCPVKGITGGSEIINHSSTSNRNDLNFVFTSLEMLTSKWKNVLITSSVEVPWREFSYKHLNLTLFRWRLIKGFLTRWAIDHRKINSQANLNIPYFWSSVPSVKHLVFPVKSSA